MYTTMKSPVLIIEDDPHFRESLIDAMSLKGFAARGVGSGAEALKAIEISAPALIIMDVQLPDRHGFDLCRQIKRSLRLKRVPILFLSARFTEPSDRAEGLMAGAEAYLCKPVSMDTLWDEIQYLLDKGS
jgi:DNA-binding response OmpR family regulator